jgi:hypothetical protein
MMVSREWCRNYYAIRQMDSTLTGDQEKMAQYSIKTKHWAIGSGKKDSQEDFDGGLS